MNKIIISILLLALSAKAGNLLPIDQISATDPSKREDYKFTSKEVEILFDADISNYVIERAMPQLNDNLVDIQLKATLSDIDYDHAIDVLPIWKKPNRIFVHLGKGWSNGGFAANLRAYTTEGGTCLVRLEKKVFETLTIEQQDFILRHEINHCLRWGHSLITNNLNHYDNIEPLLRLYDVHNTKKTIVVPLSKTTYFSNKRFKVASRDTTVKLVRGRYKVNGKRVSRIGKTSKK